MSNVDNVDPLREALLAHSKGHEENLNADSYNLLKIPWKIVGYLTWAEDYATNNTAKAKLIREQDFKDLIYSTCLDLRLSLGKLLVYAKHEYQGRWHLNFLIAEQGAKRVSADELSKALQDSWRHKGRAEVYPVKPEEALKCVTYISKIEFKNGEALFPDTFVSEALKEKFKQNRNLQGNYRQLCELSTTPF